MFEIAGPHVFALPPGVDFPKELVLGLVNRMRDRQPEDMARVTLYVNTSRMRRRIIALFGQERAGFLPKILLISELSMTPVLAELPKAISPLRRRLELAKLINALLKAQPTLAPRATLYDLADSLASLIDEMHGEGVTPQDISSLDVSNHSGHWLRTQSFLKIITPFVTEKLNPDPQARQRMAVLRLLEHWQANPPPGPIIVAGSTGSRGTTALFMAGVARLSMGAIVLPGFDFETPQAVWNALEESLTSEDHPQYRYKKLIDLYEISPSDILPWTNTTVPDTDRNRLISLSLRPAPVTDQWLVEGPDLPDLVKATEKMTLIEASGPRQEATAIALILRKAAQDGITAALVTPDRNLTRQVVAALDRWGVLPDDSAGKPLGLSAPGRFLRQTARLFGRKLTSDQLLTILKHPLTSSGADRGTHLRFTRELELKLRRNGPAFPVAQDLMQWAALQKDPGCMAWAEAISKSLRQLDGPQTLHLTHHLERHQAVCEQLARGVEAAGSGALWAKEAGQAAQTVWSGLHDDAPFGDMMSCAEYVNFIDSVLSQGEVRETVLSHPRIMIWGTLEARVQGADLVVLGGLNDGVWPGMPPLDPWLNRQMRKDAGLLLPERSVGLAAHDYQQAIAADTVILTRSVRNADAATVASRWVNRLTNLLGGLTGNGGDRALAAMRERGQAWLDLAQVLDRPTPEQAVDPRLIAAQRPAPMPPVGVRPKTLSLTHIRTLIRDPYAIYAKYILRLKPLDPLKAGVDARDRGTAFHAILERFAKERPVGETPVDAKSRLLDIAAAVFATETPFPTARALWRAKIERAADHFLSSDTKHDGVMLAVETKGSLRLDPLDFVLSGTPDRIDLLPNGKLHLIDYKTGVAPTPAQQQHFEKQLLLAAAMAERGGFGELGPLDVGVITYVSLGSAEKDQATTVTSEMLDIEWEKLITLMTRYAERKTGYVARRAIFMEKIVGDYDHLARHHEWEMSDRAAPVYVGSKDLP